MGSMERGETTTDMRTFGERYHALRVAFDASAPVDVEVAKDLRKSLLNVMGNRALVNGLDGMPTIEDKEMVDWLTFVIEGAPEHIELGQE